MKKLQLILIMFVAANIFACKLTTTPEERAKKTLDSLNLSFKANKQLDSITKALTQDYDDSKSVNFATALKTIKITNYYTSEPNSACGVDCNIVWQNLSSKTVKYAHFTVEPINAVNDVVNSTIGDKSKCRVSVTGPIAPNAWSGYGTYWECVWYNCTIAKMRITKVEIEYMDGGSMDDVIISGQTLKDLIKK